LLITAQFHLSIPLNTDSEHGDFFWCVALLLDPTSGLSKASTADAAQTRALDTARFEARLGALEQDDVDLIAEAVARCVKRAAGSTNRT